MVAEAEAESRLQAISLECLEQAALLWGAGAFLHAVILDPFRGNAHCARAIAYQNLARFYKYEDLSKAAQYRLEARKDFFFAGLLLLGEQKDQARGHLAALDYFDNARTDGGVAGLVTGWPIQNGETFTGDRRLLVGWNGRDLDVIVDRRGRPQGW